MEQPLTSWGNDVKALKWWISYQFSCRHCWAQTHPKEKPCDPQSTNTVLSDMMSRRPILFLTKQTFLQQIATRPGEAGVTWITALCRFHHVKVVSFLLLNTTPSLSPVAPPLFLLWQQTSFTGRKTISVAEGHFSDTLTSDRYSTVHVCNRTIRPQLLTELTTSGSCTYSAAAAAGVWRMKDVSAACACNVQRACLFS